MLGLLGTPATNSIESFVNCLHKPVIYSRLLRIRKELGFEAFPLIDQTYHASWKGWNFHSDFPLVLKLGTMHAGLGKARIMDQDGWDDAKSLVATQGTQLTHWSIRIESNRFDLID